MIDVAVIGAGAISSFHLDGTRRVLVDGRDGRTTIEIITHERPPRWGSSA
jgi:hypothetical protein